MLIADLNKAEVIKSPILAKAVFFKDKHYEVIIVHQASTLNEFYWQYAAKSRRSPRKAWKFAKTFARDLDPRYFSDFDSFVAHYAATREAKFLSSRVPKPRELALLATGYKTIKASIDQNITMQLMWTMRDKANGIFKQKFDRKSAWDKWVNAERETQAIPVPEGEIHVFYDECETCHKHHSFAHFPNGKMICGSDMHYTQSNPAVFYAGHEHGRFIFKFRNPAHLTGGA